jgi:ferric-dicitrate binding protein FerR (iron transport regulator)
VRYFFNGHNFSKMIQSSTTIRALLGRYANGDATPDEKRQLEEWASLSAENLLWYQQFSDKEWLEDQAASYNKIDLDERIKTLWSMVAAEPTPPVQTTQLIPEPVTGKVLSIGFYVRAAIIIVILGCTCYLLLPVKKTNQTAGNNVQQSTADNNTRLRNVYKPTAVDSFSSSGLYMQVSTDEAANEPLYHKWTIPAAGYREIKLPDGSKVWLSSTTTFIYPRKFNGNKRVVEITGEAYFEVDSNAAVPFLAIVNGVHIETTGGSFNVKAHEQEAVKKVTVLQGEVTVTAGPYAVLIKANQSALVEKKKRPAIQFNEDIDKVMAWKDRKFLFKNDSLGIVIKEFARRYNLTLAGNINSDALISYEGSRVEEPEVVLSKMHQQNRNFLYKLKDRVLTIE